MTAPHVHPLTRPVSRPAYVWLSVGLEVFTALGAIPVGIQLLRDPSGAAIGLPADWIEATPFGTYLELISYPGGMAYEDTVETPLWDPRDNRP